MLSLAAVVPDHHRKLNTLSAKAELGWTTSFNFHSESPMWKGRDSDSREGIALHPQSNQTLAVGYPFAPPACNNV